MILPPVPVRYIISISIWRNQQYLHNKSHARVNHCQSRKKLLPCHLLQFFTALCHAFSLSSLQDSHLVFLLWAQCQRAHLISVQGHPRKPALRLNPSPRHSTLDELCFSLRVFFPHITKQLSQIGVTDDIHSGRTNAVKTVWHGQVFWDEAKQ